MSLLELLQPAADADPGRQRHDGVAVALVTNNQDPDGLGRVKLQFPWLSEEAESDWARVASPMAGASRGVFLLPEVDDEVLVAFEHGDVNKPLVLGGLWDGADPPPHDNADGENNLRVIHSRSGHVITLDDTEGSEKIEIVDQAGKNTIVIDSAESTITLTADKDLVLSAPNGKIALEAQDLEIKASASAAVKADQGLDLEAGATLTVKGQTVNIN